MRISGVIHTFNEEKNIANAIRSLLPWVDEVVVIDMFSEDNTLQIAEYLGAKVFRHTHLGFVEPAREFGVQQTSGDWILLLDADEMIPTSLASSLTKIAQNGEADIVNMSRKNYIMGQPFHGAGWGIHEDRGPRFFKKGSIKFSPVIHSRPEFAANARIANLESTDSLAIIHFNYVDATHVIEKMNRYTSIEAELQQNRGDKAKALKTLKIISRAFVSRYIYRRGYREGWRGFFMCSLMVMYEIAALTKRKEIEDREMNGPIEARYARIAEEVLRQYGPEAENNGYKFSIRETI